MHTVDACPMCGGKFVSYGYEYMTTVGGLSLPGHDHDDNCLYRPYTCENGHVTALWLRRSCPACDWKGKETCFCHGGKKLDRWPILKV